MADQLGDRTPSHVGGDPGRQGEAQEHPAEDARYERLARELRRGSGEGFMLRILGSARN